MQHATAGTSGFPCDGGKIAIVGEQQLVEGGIRQQGCVQGKRPSRLKALTIMAKPGRNDPCHCGSGKKYKKCCQPKEEAAEREVIANDQAAREERAEARRAQQRATKAEFLARFAAAGEVDEELEQLTAASNTTVELVKAGKLEEAEAAARDLLERFPHVHDGWDRLGMVHEARGQKKPAADCYRKAIEIIRAQPENYDPEFANVFVELVDKLDPRPNN